jgi:hypothetical protein
MYLGFSSFLSLSAVEGNISRPADLMLDHGVPPAYFPAPVPGP